MMQKVALTWYCASRSRTAIEEASGPSSKVSATAEVPVVLIEPAGPPVLSVVDGSGDAECADGEGLVLARTGAVDGACEVLADTAGCAPASPIGGCHESVLALAAWKAPRPRASPARTSGAR